MLYLFSFSFVVVDERLRSLWLFLSFLHDAVHLPPRYLPPYPSRLYPARDLLPSLRRPLVILFTRLPSCLFISLFPLDRYLYFLRSLSHHYLWWVHVLLYTTSIYSLLELYPFNVVCKRGER